MNLTDLWSSFSQEKSFALSPTTVHKSYRQVSNWVSRNPHQQWEEGRLALMHTLQQSPQKAALKVAGYLKTMFRWAAETELIPRNPVASFKLPKAPQMDDPVVIPAELIPVVVRALKRSSINEARWDLVANWHLQTGCRPAEGFGLLWSDIDWDNQRFTVARNMTVTHGVLPRTKTNRKRVVPLNDTAMQILHEMRELHSSEFVFPWSRYSYMSAFKRVMQRLYDEGTIPVRYRPYDLRHTQISIALERGVSVAQVASWAGNTPETCWKSYVGVSSTYEMPTI